MNVSSVSSLVNSYYNYTLNNTLSGSGKASEVPLVTSVTSTVKDQYAAMKFQGITQNTELDNIYNELDKSASESTTNLSTSPISSKVVDIFDSIKNGTYKPDYTSIMASNPTSVYSSINSITEQNQMAGNFINSMV